MNNNNQKGFTLVELMIAVALVGAMAAIAVPNFKKYQAKAKTSEAKIQLAAIYVSETSFYQLYDMYATCLDYMGFDPSREKEKRHYAVGFPNLTSDIDINFYNSAVGERLVTSDCPRDLSDTEGMSIFTAGKSVGQAVMDNIGDFQIAAATTSNNLNDGSGPYSWEVYAGIGTQINESTKTFTAAAAGYISSEYLTPLEASYWTINQSKKLTNLKTGY